MIAGLDIFKFEMQTQDLQKLVASFENCYVVDFGELHICQKSVDQKSCRGSS